MSKHTEKQQVLTLLKLNQWHNETFAENTQKILKTPAKVDFSGFQVSTGSS